jgi:hypothetical protein
VALAVPRPLLCRPSASCWVWVLLGAPRQKQHIQVGVQQGAVSVPWARPFPAAYLKHLIALQTTGELGGRMLPYVGGGASLGDGVSAGSGTATGGVGRPGETICKTGDPPVSWH